MEPAAFSASLDNPSICSVCLDTFKDPVAIPCGHSFCMGCIGAHWDDLKSEKKGVCCPLCKETFGGRPQLCINRTLVELLEHFQTGGQQAAAPEPSSSPEDILCDFCTEEQTKASRSCLVCMASYCEPHLKPHLKNPVFQSHRLVPPVRHMEEKLCKVHLKPLEGFCRTDQACVCYLCEAQDHAKHEVVLLEQERKQKEAQRLPTLRWVEMQMQETKANLMKTLKTVEFIKSAAPEEKAAVKKLVTEASTALEKLQEDVTGFIECEERVSLSLAEENQRQLQERFQKLSQKWQTLEQLFKADTVSFIKEFQKESVKTDCPALNFNNKLGFTKCSQAVRAVRDVVLKSCRTEWDTLSGKGDAEPPPVNQKMKLSTVGQLISRGPVHSKPQFYDGPQRSGNLQMRSYFLQYAHQVVFDADTAERFLALTGNEVKRQSTPLDYPENKRRFTNCAQVLGQGLASEGCYYWEVEIITGYVSLGLANELLNSKGSYEAVRLGRNNCSWCLRWDGERLAVWHNHQETVITRSYHKIGIFLDFTTKPESLTFFGVKPSRMQWLHQFPITIPIGRLASTVNHVFPAFYLESVGAHLKLGPHT